VISCGDGGQTDNWIGSEDEEESRSRVTGSATVSIPDRRKDNQNKLSSLLCSNTSLQFFGTVSESG
jgi:hypothetical protein